MTDVVGDVMGQGAEGEGQLVDVSRIANHRLDKVAGARVVQEVAEKLVAERIVANVLNHRSAVRVRMRIN
jgi:hypothetical protein